MIILISIIGAFLNRCRGGLLTILFNPDESNTFWKKVGKFGNAVGFGLLCGYLASNYYAIPVGIVAMLVGASFGWGKYIAGIFNKTFDVNEVEISWIDKLVMQKNDYPVLRSITALSLRGLIWTSIIAAMLAPFNLAFLYFAPVGLLMGLVYFTSRSWHLGEYIWGAILWGSLTTIGTLCIG
jgi:hypothetical protein